MSSGFLRAADGMGWAVFVLGLVCALGTVLAALARPAGTTPDLYLFLLLLSAGMLAGSRAFHRRRWWAWDLSIAFVLLLWTMAPYLVTAQIAPVDPDAGAARFIVLGVLTLIFGIPFPAAAVALLHKDVRQAFPHPLPLAPRLVAAIFAAGAPLQLIESISADPRLFFGAALPRWGTVLWAVVAALGYLCAGIGLYQRRRFARPLGGLIAAFIVVQAAAGLFRPSLSSLPPDFHYPTVGNAVNLLFAFALAVALLLPRRSAQEFPGQPPPAAFPELRR